MKRSLPARYGRWAVVAGASRGLGAAFAEELAKRGMSVVLLARRGDVLEDVAGRLHADHEVDVRCVTLDLASADVAATLADAVRDIDLGIVIYNAARIPIGGFLDMDEDVLEQVVSVNVRGPLLLGPWLYPLYYVALLLPRERDDDRRCAEKYGPLWEQYRASVPWRIVPRIY